MTPPPRETGRLAVPFAATVAALATAVVYRQVLGGYFWNDDFAWLFLLHDRGLTEFLLTPQGGQSLVARNALFAALDKLAGLDPRPWFALTLLTHAVNVGLLARVVWLFTRSALLAGVGALLWGTCPANSETLAWYSVYGQIAATTCLLAALGRVGVRARAGVALSRSDLVFVAAWTAVSSLFFGTGIAFACAWPIAAALLVPKSAASRRGRVHVLAVTMLVLILYLGLQVIARLAYGTRVFGPVGLALALARPWTTAVAFVHLLRVGAASLVLGAYWTPVPYPDIISWVAFAAAMAIAVMAVARARSDARGRILAFGVLCVSGYAVIAVARAPLADAILRMTAAGIGATMRYHYAPLAFLTVAFVVALDASIKSRLARDVLMVAWTASLLWAEMSYGVPVNLHDPSRVVVRDGLRAINAAITATPHGEVAYVMNEPLPAFGWVPNTTEPPPGLAALFVITSPGDTVDGRAVRFVEPDPVVRERAAREGGRTRMLLVAPSAGRQE